MRRPQHRARGSPLRREATHRDERREFGTHPAKSFDPRRRSATVPRGLYFGLAALGPQNSSAQFQACAPREPARGVRSHRHRAYAAADDGDSSASHQGAQRDVPEAILLCVLCITACDAYLGANVAFSRGRSQETGASSSVPSKMSVRPCPENMKTIKQYRSVTGDLSERAPAAKGSWGLGPLGRAPTLP